jgi:hypothetical protein
MKPRLLAALVCAGTTCAGMADQPTAPAQTDICSVPHNQVLGPKVNVSALPLLKGDPAQPKRACSVTWSVLSPGSQPLPIIGCYKGRLLRVQNNTACGNGTDFLWVERVWVVTSADRTLARTSNRLANCQMLDTTSTAATREYHPECAPQKSSQQPNSNAAVPVAR